MKAILVLSLLVIGFISASKITINLEDYIKPFYKEYDDASLI